MQHSAVLAKALVQASPGPRPPVVNTPRPTADRSFLEVTGITD